MMAPDWFLRLWEESEVMGQKGLDALGISNEWWTGRSKKEKCEFIEIWSSKLIPTNVAVQQTLVDNALRGGAGLATYAWAKFRLENLENEFGVANYLYFDQEAKEIVMKISFQDKLVGLLKSTLDGDRVEVKK